MADRGRDLKIGILSDVSKFDLGAAATDLEDLADKASTSDRRLDDLDRTVRKVDIDRLGTEAKDTARKVDSAFDTIARASKQSSQKLDGNTRDMKGSLRDVRDEAGDTAREMGASFSTSGDIGDAFQELAANAGVVFGPIGVALGAAAAVGVGLFRTRMDQLKTQVDGLVDAIIEGGGRIDDAFVKVKLQDFAKDGSLAEIEKLVAQYKIAGVTYRDVARAKAGDAAASAKVTAALEAESARRKTSDADLTRSEAAVAALTAQIGSEQEAMRLAQAATADYAEATADGTATAKVHVDAAAKGWDDLKATYGEDIIGKLRVDSSQVLRDAQIAWVNADRYFQRNPITIRTKPGARPIKDVP